MDGAVGLQNGVIWVDSALTTGEGDVGQAEVGAVEDDDAVVAQQLQLNGIDGGVEETG